MNLVYLFHGACQSFMKLKLSVLSLYQLTQKMYCKLDLVKLTRKKFSKMDSHQNGKFCKIVDFKVEIHT